MFATLVLSAEAQTSVQPNQDVKVQYTILSDTTVSVSLASSGTLPLVLEIPAAVELTTANTDGEEVSAKYTVVAVADSGFFGATALSKVKVNAKNLKIGSHAFMNCDSLTNVYVPDGVDGSIESIGNNAFYGCGKLNMDLSSVKEIGAYAFFDCFGLDSVTLAEGITEIAPYTFSGCSSLANFTFPKTLVSIEEGAFSNDTMLQSVSFPTQLTNIGMWAFGECDGLTSITIPAGVVTLGSEAFMDCESLSTVIFDSGSKMESFGTSCFESCVKLDSISLPSTLTCVSKRAFEGCEALGYIYLPSGVAVIDENAFYNCIKLGHISLPESLTEIGESAFSNCANLTFDSFPSGLKSIGDMGFYGCSDLTSVYFPIAIESIGVQAFAYCTGLSSIAFPKSLTYIGNECLSGCTSLNSAVLEDGIGIKTLDGVFSGAGQDENFEVVIGSGVDSIADYAFQNSKAVVLTLPKTLRTLGADALSSSSVARINCYAVNPPSFDSTSDGNSFRNLTSLNVYVPNASVSAYKEAWGTVVESVSFSELYNYSLDATGDTIGVSSAQGLVDVFTDLSDTQSADAGKNVDMKSDVAFGDVDLDLETLSAENVYTVMDKLPTIESFSGEWNGAAVNNITARSVGLFNTIPNGAQINNLAFNDAKVYADLTDTQVYEQKGDTVFIPILAKTVNGSVTGFSFNGSIIVDADLAKDKEIAVCLADEAGENAKINGIIYLDDVKTTGTNKRCITIKQNLGVRNSKTAKIKMAKQKFSSSANKSLDGDEYEYSEDELNKTEREFSDEEFASGVVAYWLNFEDVGYTGDYVPRWSQGKTLPVAATVKNGVTNALYPVDYGATDMSHITSGKRFANNGSVITIAYDRTPKSITVGDSELESFGTSSVSITFDHSKPINILFGGAEKSALPQVLDSGGDIGVSVSGRVVSIVGAEGTPKILYALTGSAVVTTNGSVLTVPDAGVYVLRVGSTSAKIVVK